MRPELIKVWNVAGMEDAHIQLSNRTSNGLERYNRHMGAMFPHAHPTLILFVQTLKAEVETKLRLGKQTEQKLLFRGKTLQGE